MNKVYKTYKYLLQIKDGSSQFAKLINRVLQEQEQEDYKFYKDSIKTIVNRYYFLVWEAKTILNVDDDKLLDYLVAALGIYHYHKDFDIAELSNCLEEDVINFNTTLTPSKIYEAINKLNNKPLSIPDKQNEIIVKRLAISYAYPEWIVKMVSKHFGMKKTYKAIASSRTISPIVCNVNEFLSNNSELSEHVEYTKGKLASTSFIYNGKEKIIDNPLFKKNKVYVEDEASQYLIDKLDLGIGDETLLISEDKGPMAINAAMKQKNVGKIHVACSNIANVVSTRKMAEIFKINCLDVFNSGIELLLSNVPNNSMDKVLIIPHSSSLGLVRRRPDVLLTLKRDDLDSIIAKEKESILEASTFVKNGGKLVYATFTYNLKENTVVVDEFLEKNPNFKLIESKHVFAHEIPSDGFFYAVMERNDD